LSTDPAGFVADPAGFVADPGITDKNSLYPLLLLGYRLLMLPNSA